MKNKLKGNIKLIVGMIVGAILSGFTVYGATILFDGDEIGYDNTLTNLKKVGTNNDVDNVQDAIDAIYQKVPAYCTNSPFQLGDYVDMTPTSTSYTPDGTLTGLVEFDDYSNNPFGTTTANTLNPSHLNVWRVIKINQDCTVEVVSEYASDVTVKFAGKKGYQNYVYVLQEIAKQYANTTYTLNPSTAADGAFRNIGYNGQTKQITNTSRIDDSTLGQTTGLWYKKTSGDETLGGGDFGYVEDLKLLLNAGVSPRVFSKGSSVSSDFESYWLTSRLYYWGTTSYWSFCIHYYDKTHFLSSDSIVANATAYYLHEKGIRPIITLKSGLSIASGSGTESSHYIISGS